MSIYPPRNRPFPLRLSPLGLSLLSVSPLIAHLILLCGGDCETRIGEDNTAIVRVTTVDMLLDSYCSQS